MGAIALVVFAGSLVEPGGWRAAALLAAAIPPAFLPAIFGGRRLLPSG
jgi:hypothetical protein